MSNKPDRTPQFYDAHTGRRSSLDHIPAHTLPKPPKYVSPTSGVKKVHNALIVAMCVGALAYGVLVGYEESEQQSPVPPHSSQSYPFASGMTLRSIPDGTPFQLDIHVPLLVQGDRYFTQGEVGRAAAIYQLCAQEAGGDPICQQRFAKMFRHGFGVPRNEVQADYWEKRAAERVRENKPVPDTTLDTPGERLGEFMGLMRRAEMNDPQAQHDLGLFMSQLSDTEREKFIALWREEKIRAYKRGQGAR